MSSNNQLSLKHQTHLNWIKQLDTQKESVFDLTAVYFHVATCVAAGLSPFIFAHEEKNSSVQREDLVKHKALSTFWFHLLSCVLSCV